jgi:probable F420-dependent oxidoreductase
VTADGNRPAEIRVGLLPPFSRRTVCDPVYVRELAAAAEEAGADSIWAVEHILVAEDYEPRYPYSADGRMPGRAETVMPDPLQLLAAFGAATERIRLGTSVLIAPQHPAAVLAKTVATLDVLSGGRVELGVGSGWQIEEYRAVGIPYESRGQRLDETIDALRSLWGPGPSSFAGQMIAFDRVHSTPKPAQEGGVPILIGGSGVVAARRAGRRGDGWFPYVVSPDEVAAGMAVIRATATAAGRDPAAIRVTVWPGSWSFATGTTPEVLGAYAAVGVDRVVVSAAEAGSDDIGAIAATIRRVRAQLAALGGGGQSDGPSIE